MKGILNIFRLFGGMFSKLFSMKAWLPIGFAGLFVIIDSFLVGLENGPKAGFLTLAQKLLLAELSIRQNVELAISASPEYTLLSVLDIIASLIVLYNVIKLIKAALIGLAGAQAPWMAWVLGLGIMGLIELVASVLLYQTFIIPIYYGLVFLVINIGPVIQNISIFGWLPFENFGTMSTEVSNEINNSLNETINQT